MSETGQKRWFSPVQMHKSRDSGWLISHPGEAAARSPPHPVKPWLKRPYFRAFNFAHLAFCAAAMLARPAALILRVGFLTATTAVPVIFARLASAAARIFARLAALIFHFFFGAGVDGGAGAAGVVTGRAKTLVISLIWASMATGSWSSDSRRARNCWMSVCMGARMWGKRRRFKPTLRHLRS